MATAWMYRSGQENCGPVPFRDLVRLVRKETLAADDLVKADWEETWRPAATVVGLFKMAGREDVLARWEAERAAAEEAAAREAARRSALATLQEDPEAERAESTLSFATADDLDLLLGGMTVGTCRTADAAGAMSPLSDTAPPTIPHEEMLAVSDAAEAGSSSAIRRQSMASMAVTSSGSSRMVEAIESAVAESETKEAAGTGVPRWSAWVKGRLPDLNGTGSGALRWGATFLFANVAAVAILSWSEFQTHRFPLGGGGASSSEIFPLWGPCSSREYAFLLIDSAILAGFCGYLAARYLEARADRSPET